MTTLTTTATAATLAAAKDRLARLMATENIKVEHDPRARTASFNVETRVLTMPVWKEMPEATSDMLIAHEVSHALHTPSGKEALLAAINLIDPKRQQVAKSYLNVVEDVRIERLMKARFPGTKPDFAKGYRWMNEQDFFGLKKVESLASLGLIDRINLQYKIGWLVEVPFAADELDLARRAATTLTWDDVVALAKEIYEKAKEQNRNRPDEEQPEPQDGEGESQDGEEGEEQETEGKAPQDRPEPQDGDETDADETDADGDETEGDETEATDETEGDKTEATDEDGDETDADEDGDETEGDGDETDTDEDTDEDGDEDGEANANEPTDEDGDDEGEAPISHTMQEVEEALLGRTDAAASVTHYADLPEVTKDFILTRKQVAESLNALGKIKANNGKTVAEIAAEMLGAWRTENLGAVQVLATEFDRRKAADEHRRTATSETGSIDPNRLWAYKISDEIFAANAYVKDGKNHGLMVLLDLSASMSGIINDTMVQLVTLAAFCRRVGLPYRFYAFTDLGLDHLGETFKGGGMKVGYRTTENSKVRLLTLLEDGMSLNEWNAQAGLLLAMGYRLGNGCGNTASAKVARDLDLMSALRYAVGAAWALNLTGHTPNNIALLGLSQVAQEFKATNRLQVVNMIVLTDGESTDCLYHAVTNTAEWAAKDYGNEVPKVVLRDKKSGKTYTLTHKCKRYGSEEVENPLNPMSQTAVMTQLFRDRVGGKVVCIHLTETAQAVATLRPLDKELAALTYDDYRVWREKAKEVERRLTAEWLDKKWAALTGENARGYDEYIMVAASTRTETVALTADPTTGAGLRSLRSQFSKQLGATKGNRPLMTRVAELLAK